VTTSTADAHGSAILAPGCSIAVEVMPSVAIELRRSPDRDRRNVIEAIRDTGCSMTLPCTADESHGMTNLASRPRAGNISTDTRAG
jgi:hypothetical protein